MCTPLNYLELDALILENAVSQNDIELMQQFSSKKFCSNYSKYSENKNLGFWLEDQRMRYQELLKPKTFSMSRDSQYLDPKISTTDLLRKLSLDNPGEEIIDLYIGRKHNTHYPRDLIFRKERDLEAILHFCKDHFRNLQNHLQSFRDSKRLEPDQNKNSGSIKNLQTDDMFEIFLAICILGEQAPVGENSPILNSFFYQSLDNLYELSESHREVYLAIMQELQYDGWLESDNESLSLSIINQEFAEDMIKKNSLTAIELAKILLKQYLKIYPNADHYQHNLGNILKTIPFSEIDTGSYQVLAKQLEFSSLNYKYLGNYRKIVDEVSLFFENMEGSQYAINQLENCEELLWLYLLALERVSEYSAMLKAFIDYTGSEDIDEIFNHLIKSKSPKIMALFFKYSYRIGKLSELQNYLNILDKDCASYLQTDDWAEALINNVRGSLAWEVFGRASYHRALHYFQDFRSQFDQFTKDYANQEEAINKLEAAFLETNCINKEWLKTIVLTAQSKPFGVMDQGSYKLTAQHCDELNLNWQRLASSYPAIKNLRDSITAANNKNWVEAEAAFLELLKSKNTSDTLAQLSLTSIKASRYWEISKAYYNDALEWFEMALVAWSDLSEKHMQLGNLQNMAAVFGDMRDFERAQEYFNEALDLCRQDSTMKLQELQVVFQSGYMYQNYIGDYPTYSQSCINETSKRYQQCEQIISELMSEDYDIPKEFLVQFYSNKGLLGLDILRKDGHDLSKEANNEQELKQRQNILIDFEVAFQYAHKIGKEEMVLRSKIYVLLLKAIESRRLRLVKQKIDEFIKKGYRDTAMMAMFELFFQGHELP